MNDQVKALLRKRVDRSIATLLGYKEKECDYYLPKEVSLDLRKKILDQLNDLYEICLDLMATVSDDSYTINEIYLQKIDEIYGVIIGEQVD